jgi:DNA-binding transcriptional LysR family regulator
MELRHLRYFVAVAEEGSFLRAAGRLAVAQPAISKQIRDLEEEIGVKLLVRTARGVRLTRGGHAFLTQARATLEAVRHASACAQQAEQAEQTAAPRLKLAHCEMGVYAPVIEGLVAEFRRAYPDVDVQIESLNEAEQRTALREHRIDVAATFIVTPRIAGLGVHRVGDASMTGALFPATHRLAEQERIRLSDLRDLTWLHVPAARFPEVYRTAAAALRKRGLVPARRLAWPADSRNVQIAAGNAWALANDVIAAYLSSPHIVFRKFVEPPIPCWIALLWRRDSRSALVRGLVKIAARGDGSTPRRSTASSPPQRGHA